MNENNYKTIDEYIAQSPSDVQETLRTLRKVIREAAPDAEEKISYQMPAFALHGNLVYFAAHKNHIGLYPAPSGVEVFKEELTGYLAGKGSIQFPLDQPMPYDLIARIVKARVAENQREAELRANARKSAKKAAYRQKSEENKK